MLDSRITFTRGSNGNYFDDVGILQSAGNNVPRFDHSPISPFTSLGFLSELQSTNICLHSGDLSDAAWVKTNTSGVKDATGIDGVTNSASTLTANAANGTCLQTVTIASDEFTYSVYVKRKTGSGVVDMTDNNLTNVTDISGSINSSTWTRLDLTRTQSNPVIGFRLVTSGDEIEVDFNQLEAARAPTSPIATTTGSVVRSQDVASMSDISWYDVNKGTFLVIGSSPYVVTEFNRNFFSINDGDSSDNIFMLANANGSAVTVVSNNSAGENASINLPGSIWTDNVVKKIALAYQTDDMELVADGGTPAVDTLVDPPTTVIEFDIGRDANGNASTNGHIQLIKYWPTRKPLAFLQAITT
jgi:hypothetical protein